LESAYRTHLFDNYGIHFNRLLVLTNMPIQRFGSTLISRRAFATYMQTLKEAHQPSNLTGVMCRNLLSVDWQGYVYDCDFNQQLGLPLGAERARRHLSEISLPALAGTPIRVADHCYGCTAGQGSSCFGTLTKNSEATTQLAA
jgi:radical SAM/Cys-rich protein